MGQKRAEAIGRGWYGTVPRAMGGANLLWMANEDRLVVRLSQFLVRRYCCVFWMTIALTIASGTAGFAIMTADAKALRGASSFFAKTSSFDWFVNSTALWQRDMVQSAEWQADTVIGNVSERSIVAPAVETALTIAFFWRDSASTDEIWSPAVLQQMCEVENVVLKLPGYKEVCIASTVPGEACAAQTRSVVSQFYPPGLDGGGRNCTRLDPALVSGRAGQLYAAGQSADPDVATAAGFLLGQDTYTYLPPRNTATRSVLSFGMPLAGFANQHDREDAQVEAIQAFILRAEEALLDHFGLRGALFSSPYRQLATTADLDVRWYAYTISQEEFARMTNSDFTAVFFSIFFVCAYIGVHTSSFALGCFGILLILFSFPLSFFCFALSRIAVRGHAPSRTGRTDSLPTRACCGALSLAPKASAASGRSSRSASQDARVRSTHARAVVRLGAHPRTLPRARRRRRRHLRLHGCVATRRLDAARRPDGLYVLPHR